MDISERRIVNISGTPQVGGYGLCAARAWPERRLGGEDDTDERVSRAITDLRDGNPDIRRDAAIDLGNMVNNSSDRQKAEKAVPALLSALKDDDADVRGDAARALGIIRGNTQKTVPAVVEALKDKDYRVRQSAAEALGRIGAQPQTAVPGLVAAIRDEDLASRGECD